jgi:hypothetical protein
MLSKKFDHFGFICCGMFAQAPFGLLKTVQACGVFVQQSYFSVLTVQTIDYRDIPSNSGYNALVTMIGY